jgi:hypothetical protein
MATQQESISMQDVNSTSSDCSMNPFEDALKGTKGKESMIAEYCRHSTRSKHACIWLCIKRGRKYRLVDVPIHQNQHVIGLREIGKHYSWWRRYSLYSVVGVEEIMVSMSGQDREAFSSNMRQGARPQFRQEDTKNFGRSDCI